jgi:hypothetical protein
MRSLPALLLSLALMPAAAMAQPGDGQLPDTTHADIAESWAQVSALQHFSGQTHERGVVLSWSMAAEHGLDHYALERSSDGQLYQMVGTVQPEGVAMQQVHHTMADTPPGEGLFYYRLRMVHAGGPEHVGPTVAVHLRYDHRKMVLFPCPARDHLTVALGHGDDGLRYILYDRQGNLLKEGALAGGRAELDVSLLPAGMHGIWVLNERDEVLQRATWMKE